MGVENARRRCPGEMNPQINVSADKGLVIPPEGGTGGTQRRGGPPCPALHRLTLPAGKRRDEKNECFRRWQGGTPPAQRRCWNPYTRGKAAGERPGGQPSPPERRRRLDPIDDAAPATQTPPERQRPAARQGRFGSIRRSPTPATARRVRLLFSYMKFYGNG